MTYDICSHFSTFARHGCSKKATAMGGVLTVPDGQDAGVVHNDRFLTLQKQVRDQGWTEILACVPSEASSLVVCKSYEDEHC